jgi:hypothetical protein
MGQDPLIHSQEHPAARKQPTLEEKLQLIDEMRGCMAHLPSGTAMLLEDRRLEREMELKKDGW